MEQGTFSGVKIADFSWVIVGPLTIEMLALHGAEVIRVESPTQTDVSRVAHPFLDKLIGEAIDQGRFASSRRTGYPDPQRLARTRI